MRRRQETLKRVNADLEQFAYSASHDLQEPIRNVAIYSDILSMRYSGVLDDSGIEFLGNVKAAAVRMQTLVSDLLSYTQAASITEEAPEPENPKPPRWPRWQTSLQPSPAAARPSRMTRYRRYASGKFTCNRFFRT
jgi:signal transduction histidine kinase